ncbi:MAG: tetratricopeptide repeat protein [Acidobacteria bacterium]|nr:tetratricopeptide repeat protein [Acidobacteriota bacterium]
MRNLNAPRLLLPTLLALLTAPLLCGAARAQQRNDALRDRGEHTLYGDIKVEGIEAAPNGSQKPLSFEVLLYIINGTPIDRQTVTSNGRYRFMNLRDGEYDVVVLAENAEVARVRVRVQSVYKNDFRQDITLALRADGKPARAQTVSAADFYKRTPANKSLFEKSQKAMDEKKYEEALALLGQLVAADPKDFQAWTELGTVHLMRSDAAEAEKAYRRAVEERPAFGLALLNLGRVLLAQKKFEEAVGPLSKAVEAQPDSADANLLLGETYLQLKKGSKAVPHLEAAARLGRPEAHLRLATLYNVAGLKDRAAAEYEQYLKQKPDAPERKKIEDYIKENKKP